MIQVHFPYPKSDLHDCQGERMWVEKITPTTGVLRNDPFNPELKLKWGDKIVFKKGTDSPYAEYEFVEKAE